MAGQNNGKQGGQQQDVNQLLKVRREKACKSAGSGTGSVSDYQI